MPQALVALLVLAACTPAPRRPDVADQIDALAAAALHDGGVSGITIALAHRELVASRGYGTATPSTTYPLASLSKQYWAAAVIDLGVELDAPVANVLAGFPDPHVRVRDLLQQTSGLGDDHDGEDDLHYTDVVPLEFPPGTWWHYSNRGAILGRRVVEQVSGKRWADYLHDRGYEDTAVCGERGFGEPPETMRRVQFVCASALDVIRFERSLDDPRYAAMRAPVVVDGVGELPYGLFTRIVELDGHRAYGHTGKFNGVSVAAFRFPADDLTIVVLENGSPRLGFSAPALFERIARAELNLREPPDAPPPAELLAQIAGEYTAGPAHGTIYARDGRVHGTVRMGDKVLWDETLAWRGGREFVGSHAGERYLFLPRTGRAQAIAIGGRILSDTLARRVEPPDP